MVGDMQSSERRLRSKGFELPEEAGQRHHPCHSFQLQKVGSVKAESVSPTD